MSDKKIKKKLKGLESLISKKGWGKHIEKMDIPPNLRDIPDRYKDLESYMKYMKERRKIKD